jgi:hypothetical protein
MEKIAAEFREQIIKQPKELYAVIVNTNVFSAPKNSNLKEIVGLDNSFTGTLTGEKILELQKSKQVVSIELDSEMNTLKPQ